VNPNVDETLARDIAEDAAILFAETGRYYLVVDAVRESAARVGEGKTEPPNDDEKARALGLARKMLRVRTEPGGAAELHPDGSRRETDAEIVRGLFGRT
jgi:hypothetical protein